MPERRFVESQLLDLMLCEIPDRKALRRQPLAGEHRQLACNGAQERGFAGAVGPEKTDALAGKDRPVDAGENRLVRITERGVVELQQLARADVRRGKVEREWAVDVRGGDQLHPLERLDPALGLLGLGRLGAETVDVRAQVFDLFLLPGVGRLLLGQRLGARALELGVVAAVDIELASIEMDDRRYDRVEKVAVVGDQQQRPRITLQPLFEPEHGVEIEMIRRLVEQQ